MKKLILSILFGTFLLANNIDSLLIFDVFTMNDTLDRQPQYDFVSDYDWQNAHLAHLPFYIFPTGVKTLDYFNWVDKNKNILKNISIQDVLTHSFDIDKKKFGTSISNYIFSLDNKSLLGLNNSIKKLKMDLSECKLSESEFMGSIQVDNNILECVRLRRYDDGFRCREATQEEREECKGEGCSEVCDWMYPFTIGLGFKHIFFTDIDNDDYMDALIWFYEIGRHSGTGSKKVILTKKSKEDKLFEVIEMALPK